MHGDDKESQEIRYLQLQDQIDLFFFFLFFFFWFDRWQAEGVSDALGGSATADSAHKVVSLAVTHPFFFPLLLNYFIPYWKASTN